MKKRIQEKRFSYSDIPTDAYGWADAKKYKPLEYDMCFLKIKGKTTRKGWFSGMNWDGFKVDCKDDVLFWKKIRGL